MYDVAVDAQGNAYVTGFTDSYNFPTTTGAFQTSGGGIFTGFDATVTKLTHDGTLVYSTYLGGANTDQGNGIDVDRFGNAFVTGSTSGAGFPTKDPYQNALGGSPYDAFVTKLNATGTGLVYSTYLGGNFEDAGQDIFVDSAGNAFVTGFTSSTSFPTANADQGTLGGNRDGFVAKLGTGGSLVFSTYRGGSFDDYGEGVAVDGSGNTYAVGRTGSTDFPTTNAFQPDRGAGGDDAFVARFGPTGAVAFSTYVGGESVDRAYGVAVDDSGLPLIVGETSSSDFPTVASSIGLECEESSPGTCSKDVFLTKMKRDGSGLIRSDYFGGTGQDEGRGIAFDGRGAVYITGSTGSDDFPTANAVQAARANLVDVFITKFRSGGIETFVAESERLLAPLWRCLGLRD
jgi:hypothetical protein